MSTASLKSAGNPGCNQGNPDAERAGFLNGPLFAREDWTLFRNLTTLCQKAGVSHEDLPRLVVKELVDNALDAGGRATMDLAEGNGFRIEDDGPGIPGTDEEIAGLFSIRRPLVSTKLLRLPTRGALGNGLRVVAGAVLSTRGSLTVATRGRVLELTPRDDGGTGHAVIGTHRAKGARVEVRLGPPVVVGTDALAWGYGAVFAAGGGPGYRGKTSPHWYDPDSFYELCQAAGAMTVRELVAVLDGCAEPKAGKVAAAFKGRPARDLSRGEAESLLANAKGVARVVNPERLGCVGRIGFMPPGYHKATGDAWFTSGRAKVNVPVCLEAWAEILDGDDAPGFDVYVNRTPVACETGAWHERHTQFFDGCGFSSGVKVGLRPARVVINLETPYVPMTNDGKTPDLGQIAGAVEKVIGKAVGSAKRCARTGPGEKRSLKSMIVECIPAGAAKAGGDGGCRFSQRQLFYPVRDMISRAGGEEIKWEYFCQVITDHEAEHGDIPTMTRDPRGTLYHPHTREEIPLGTLEVERYRRPAWTFNKILYCEKEGLFSILRAVGWPERNDCALMSSKGYATRAARDVFDALGETDEEITFFCVHDCDAFGTMIYQSLQGATRARGARRVLVVNLGLDVDEALASGLPVEPVERRKDAPVAGYVDPGRRAWFQSHRVELNAMTTPEFLAWLDAKFAPYAAKVVPPTGVMAERLSGRVGEDLREIISERVLAEAGIDGLVERSLAERRGLIDDAVATIVDDVSAALDEQPDEPWSAPVERAAGQIARADLNRGGQ